jgi:NAD(P)-dependent dehydrogenase (short-subunit alcohol dehydrogenase family)
MGNVRIANHRPLTQVQRNVVFEQFLSKHDLQGKVALITGGTDGIGYEIARALAHRMLSLIVVGRDYGKGMAAEIDLRGETGNPNVHFLQADVSLARHVERLSEEVGNRWPKLHFLVHSAGIVRGWRELNADGVESNFATNYLSRFLVSCRLLPLMQAAGEEGNSARIVIISGAAQFGAVHYEDVNLTKNFNTLRAVLQFCRANDVFTVEFARRLAVESNQVHVTMTCLKVGVVKTNIRKTFPRWMKWLVPVLFDPLLGQTAAQAAEAALHLLLSDEYEGESGTHFMKIKKFKRVRRLDRLRNPQDGRRLWKLSEKLEAGPQTARTVAG